MRARLRINVLSLAVIMAGGLLSGSVRPSLADAQSTIPSSGCQAMENAINSAEEGCTSRGGTFAIVSQSCGSTSYSVESTCTFSPPPKG